MFTYFCARFGDGTEVIHHVGLGHTDARVTDSENFILLIGNDEDIQVLAGVEHRRFREGGIANFVEGVGGVGDELTQEDLLVGVEGI